MGAEIQILTWKDKDKWNSYLDIFPDKDVYFHADYCKAYEDNGEGEANLLVYEAENSTLIYPFIKRRINDIEIFKDYSKDVYDIITPYGYGGPIMISEDNEKCNNYTNEFCDVLHKYCLEENIISEFVRFHPILQNQGIFKWKYDVKLHNHTVYTKVSGDIEEIWNNQIKKNARNKIRKAKKNSVEVFICNSKDKLMEVWDAFEKLYYLTMDKNEAANYYYFSDRYFNRLKELIGKHLTIFYAMYKKNIIAVSLVIYMDKFVHIHLTGSDKNYLDLAPNNLIRYEIIKWANYKGFKLVHHGGGTQKDDGLFKFKSMYSRDTANFYIGYRVHNQNIYNELCSINKELNDLKKEEISFFPLYRYNL